MSEYVDVLLHEDDELKQVHNQSFKNYIENSGLFDGKKKSDKRHGWCLFTIASIGTFGIFPWVCYFCYRHREADYQIERKQREDRLVQNLYRY